MEKLQAYERIIIANSRLNLIAAQLVHLRSDLIHVRSKSGNEFVDERIQDIEGVLQDTAAAVTIAFDKASSFMENIDAVGELDIHLFERIDQVLYDVVDMKCESCEKSYDMDLMSTDDAGNYFCPPCYKELAPVMKAEYDELVARGEIDPEVD